MPFHLELPPTFTSRVQDASRPQIGMWVSSGSPVAAEILAGSGMDWILIDGEHSPYGLETITELLRSTDAYPATAVVRVPAVDRVLIKQYLDLGVQNIMVPMVHDVEIAKEAVASVHYPPRGVRGVGSALARASRWGAVPDYLNKAAETISLIIQIESEEAVTNSADIAALDGVDAAFIGPSDLAASMGLLGLQTHPDVVAGVKKSIQAFRDAGKPVGVNAFDLNQAQDYLNAGANFVLVGADVQQLNAAARGLVEKFITPLLDTKSEGK
ncbi:HpcH/HpaI aldolase family protein [Corynebacterium glutamicum]|uniref:HpcH/HpaI aldolase family protein n=1 Tax=Corynebacterium glutamicum TaxID=1718 RepID=UPI000942844C|nr:HpcH/HpaI aldolase/citrate lyase family protein [Corynebacterium glutamicum]OKX86690.1 2-dehydro-3-deoxyglucarate aldolase [Corynebacterium glutamicum]QDX74328.1 alpha-dehydro-beta-deoxy-D-glucarate aldolase [Corynebacterium glutamicum]QDX77086.1 alpha-dehydro-beta-deoxy-D-glucarate aldolase [Corynebacterium glutamicum]TWS37005.1 alpha-dehydro-beta-deoxy-D-glucarate aldolase [Corynebacterium glutamicum]TWS37795.1 alpha-dehydro-beta-deoxy-D-glucarate aldolase [Corynebacterium glutamicum]